MLDLDMLGVLEIGGKRVQISDQEKALVAIL
jgi:hypothetical protein